MKQISLFSGGGGFDLASEWIGWENIAHCEIDSDCLKILKYYWPNAKTHTDIRTTDFTIYRGQCDVLTGGFPCQPFSVAGEQIGVDDPRHLFPQMFRAIREIKPRWIVAENVYGIATPKFATLFEQICSSLENEGYSVQPIYIPATVYGANHRRDRVWIIAYSGVKPTTLPVLTKNNGYQDYWQWNEEVWCQNWNIPEMASRLRTFLMERVDRPGIAGIVDGLPPELDVEAIVRSSIGIYGNAVMPQAVIPFFKAIEQYELTQVA